MHRGVYPTDSGMHCLWDQSAFASVNDYDSWASELLEDTDIARHIAAGHYVPISIGSDGAMEIEVRLGTPDSPAALMDRESKYLVVKSDPYRLHSTGAAGVCGIEYVAMPPSSDVGSIALQPGDYAVTVHLIAWDEEPGMQTDDGPAPGALSDYVVLINPATPGTQFRTSIETFDRPSAS